MKDKRKINKFILIFRIISIIVIIYCLIYIIHWFLENKKSADILKQISDTSILDTKTIQIPTTSKDVDTSNSAEITTYQLDFNNLLSQNNSTVGWLIVQNSNINYPVVQHSNNNFYLNHSFDKSYNSAGWIFADYRNKFDGTDKNIIIYGHNRKDSSMFATLTNTQKEYWYNNPANKYISFTTPSNTNVYEIFSVYTIKAETYYLTTSFINDDSYLQFLNTMKSRSIYDFGVSLQPTDNIITLSTCDSTGNSRIIVHAKKIL